jgi:hypothetical protein
MNRIFHYYVFPVGAIGGALFVVVFLAVNWQLTLTYLGVLGTIALYHAIQQGRIRLF